jgi:hypothetical protein
LLKGCGLGLAGYFLGSPNCFLMSEQSIPLISCRLSSKLDLDSFNTSFSVCRQAPFDFFPF